MTYIPRSASGLPAPTGGATRTTARSNRTGVVVHWDGGRNPTSAADEIALMKAYERHHRSQGWEGFAYNLAVGPLTGNVYEGRGLDNIGAHAGGANTANIGVVLIGGPGNLTEAGKAGLREAYALANAHVGRTLAPRVHRQINSTTCPGDEIAAFVAAGGLSGGSAPATAAPAAPSGLVVDGDWGKLTTRALQRALGVGDDGVIGPITARALQRKLGVTADGIIGPITRRALQRHLGVAQDAVWGPQTARALQTRLNAGTF